MPDHGSAVHSMRRAPISATDSESPLPGCANCTSSVAKVSSIETQAGRSTRVGLLDAVHPHLRRVVGVAEEVENQFEVIGPLLAIFCRTARLFWISSATSCGKMTWI